MDRWTHRTAQGRYIVDSSGIEALEEGWGGEAVERLAAYENLRETLEAEVRALAAALEELRTAGKERTYRYRELMAKKFTDNQVLDVLTIHGL